MKRTFVAVLLAVALAAAAVSPAAAFFDKPRFAEHLGLAYYAFHTWVMTPFRAGAFENGAPHRSTAMVKGEIVLFFAADQVRDASRIAHRSKDPLLQKIAGSVDQLGASFGTVGRRFQSGQYSPDDVKALDSATSSLGSTAAAGGVPIKDIPNRVPGVGRLRFPPPAFSAYAARSARDDRGPRSLVRRYPRRSPGAAAAGSAEPRVATREEPARAGRARPLSLLTARGPTFLGSRCCGPKPAERFGAQPRSPYLASFAFLAPYTRPRAFP